MIETFTPALKIAAASAVGIGASLPVGAILLLRQISNSVDLAPPTASMLTDENPQTNAPLFRHLPQLTDKLAWRSLGAIPRTPVHTCHVPATTTTTATTKPQLELLVKREDLLSPLYGGNKVRTLQHQLAVCEARRERGESQFRQLVSFGTGGSNQVVATVVHARGLGWDGGYGNGGEDEDAARINVVWGDKDEPDLDNTLNMLSVLSFPNVGWKFNWGETSSLGMGRFLGAIWAAWSQKEMVPMMPGGNSPSGVLGQVGGLLELAEQIVAGESPDPERIYVPVGSACTISGLIVGTVLARHLGIPALSHPNFKIVGCNVHDGLASMDNMVGFHVRPIFGFMPTTITYSVKSVCAALVKLGGPDIEAEALDFIKTSVEIRADADVVGTYGAHSEKTRAAAKLYDEKGTVVDSRGKEAKNLWLCGHFAAKAFQPLLRDLETVAADDGKEAPKYMLWMTKSAVQPRGNVDEWSKMLQENETILKWANEGKSESSIRPGKVSTNDGSPDDYRSLMTKVL